MDGEGRGCKDLDFERRRGRPSLKLLLENHVDGLETLAVAMK